MRSGVNVCDTSLTPSNICDSPSPLQSISEASASEVNLVITPLFLSKVDLSVKGLNYPAGMRNRIFPYFQFFFVFRILLFSTKENSKKTDKMHKKNWKSGFPSLLGIKTRPSRSTMGSLAMKAIRNYVLWQTRRTLPPAPTDARGSYPQFQKLSSGDSDSCKFSWFNYHSLVIE